MSYGEALRATVERLSPLEVSTPTLGGLVLLEPCVQVGNLTLAVGDEVLAIRTEGHTPDSDLYWIVTESSGGEGSGNLDGGYPDSVYGGLDPVDGGAI